MTTSLNSFIPFLSEALRLNPSALYERLRALVRLELLESVPGRGPGTGVRFGPDALATLLISHMATDNIADAAQMTTALSNASLRRFWSAEAKVFAGAKSFKDALVKILADDAVAREFTSLRIHRGEMPWAEVFLKSDPEGTDPCVFDADSATSYQLEVLKDERGMIFNVEVKDFTIFHIRERLKKIDREAGARRILQGTTKPIAGRSSDRSKKRTGTRK